MTQELSQTPEESDPAGAEEPIEGSLNPARLVPVAESIKYRRRAQQAEGRLAQIEQQLTELQTQLAASQEQMSGIQSQRDEAQNQLRAVENSMSAERMLSQAGVVDIEAASMLLSKRVNLQEQVDPKALAQTVEQLLQDKPYLRGARPAALPGKTASERSAQAGVSGMLAQVGQRAIRTGDRRDVSEYLRLRRQAARP